MGDPKEGLGEQEALAGCIVSSLPSHQGLDRSGDRSGSGPSDWSLGPHLKSLLLLRHPYTITHYLCTT